MITARGGRGRALFHRCEGNCCFVGIMYDGGNRQQAVVNKCGALPIKGQGNKKVTPGNRGANNLCVVRIVYLLAAVRRQVFEDVSNDVLCKATSIIR